uniref:Uncharacterized protein n=1 Tax=Biomphalaria glabrata TaxID=6526 RepID=A0A2C9LMD2_BIOGL
MAQANALIFSFTILCAINVKGTQGQTVMFYENIAADTNECTETHEPGSNSIVLRGQAHLPTQSNWTSYIVFDQKSDTSNDFKLLCLVDTRSQCASNSVSDICYCQPTQAADTYQFVVNISPVTTEMSGLVRAYLMMKNSTSVFTKTSLSSWRESHTVKTSLTINDEPVGEHCMKTIHGKNLKIEARCTGMRGPCWLELTMDHVTTPIVGNGHIFFEDSVESDSNITVVLRRSRCNKNNFQEMYTCQITTVTSLEVLEASNDTVIIIGVVLAVLVVSIVVIAVVVYKKKCAHREPPNHRIDLESSLENERNIGVKVIHGGPDTLKREKQNLNPNRSLPDFEEDLVRPDNRIDDMTRLLNLAEGSTQDHCTADLEEQTLIETSTHSEFQADYLTSSLLHLNMEGSQDMATAEPNEAAYATSLSQLPCSIDAKTSLETSDSEETQDKYTNQLGKQTPARSCIELTYKDHPKEVMDNFDRVMAEYETKAAMNSMRV